MSAETPTDTRAHLKAKVLLLTRLESKGLFTSAIHASFNRLLVI